MPVPLSLAPTFWPGAHGSSGIAVQVAARDRVAQILALGVDLEASPEAVVQARRDPVEGIRDRRPSRNLGALIAGNREARLVVPVDVRAPRPLFVEQSDGEGGRGRRIDGADEVAELIVAAGSGRREAAWIPKPFSMMCCQVSSMPEYVLSAPFAGACTVHRKGVPGTVPGGPPTYCSVPRFTFDWTAW